MRTQWRGQPDTLRWRFWGLLGLSLALHSALTPWAALLGLLGLLGLTDKVDMVDLPPITAIPVDLIEEPPVPESADPPPQPEPSGTSLAAPEPEAEQPAESQPVKEKETAKDEAGADADEEAKEVGDPVALSGSAGKLADTNANVRIKVDTEKVRRHRLGPRIGQVLARVPQWHDFLGPANLDPIRDVDRLLIAGPQLRDSSEVIAVLKYNVEQSRMEAAIDSLVQRSSGEWLEGPTKAATARADRAERIFSFIAPGLVAIVPPSAKADALKRRPKGATFPAIPGDVVLTAFVVTPHQVYTGLPIKLPESFAWIRASVTPDAEGGAVAHIEAEDASAEQATAHAEWLERRVIAATSPQGIAAAAARFLYGGDKFLNEVSFEAKGSRITGTLSVTAAQLDMILSIVEGIIESWNPKPRTDALAPGAPAASPSSSAPFPPRPISREADKPAVAAEAESSAAPAAPQPPPIADEREPVKEVPKAPAD